MLTKTLDFLGLHRDGNLRGKGNQIYGRIFHRGNRPKPIDIDSYSQFGEDVFVRHLLSGRHGTYVDIGSGHPISGSNSYAFYKLGWTGILVDPVASNIEASQAARKRDRIVQACVGGSGEGITFFEYDVYQYSTTSLERVEELRSLGYEPKLSYLSPMVKLSDLGVEAKPTDACFLSIDVEGMEMQVLESNDWSKFLPAVLLIEEWDAPLGKTTQVCEYLRGFGYHLVAVLGPTSIYQHQDFQPAS